MILSIFLLLRKVFVHVGREDLGKVKETCSALNASRLLYSKNIFRKDKYHQKKIPLSNKLTFRVHGYSNWWFEPFVVHQTFDGHVFQQPWLDSQCAYDQGGPVALWEVGRHRGAHGAIIPLHIPHYLYWGAWHWGAVGFDHTRRGSLVAHLRFGQHCVE